MNTAIRHDSTKCGEQEHHMSLEGAVVHVSLHPGPSPSNCIVSFAVGPPVLVEFTSDSTKQLPAFIMGRSHPLQTACHHTIVISNYALLTHVLGWVF